MTKYVFLFTTDHRKIVNLEVKDPPLQFSIPFDNAVLKASMFLYGTTAFNVEVTSEREINDMGGLANVLHHTISGLYDAIGLSTGSALEVRIEGFWEVRSGQCGKVSFSLPTFAKEITAAGLLPHDWISVVTSSPQLRASLRDIRLAMETPIDTAVHCYRAIERVRQFFATDKNRKQSWQSLATALNVERSWLDSYTAHATAVRHGELVALEIKERDDCLSQAAIVIIRFAAYLKGGGSDLTAPKFPLLS
jgi:hypothetical protein